MFAGDGAAHADAQVGGFLHERPVGGQAVGGAQVEAEPGVDAPLTEMAVHGAGDAVPVHDLAQLAHVLSDPVGRHRGVLPAGPVVRAVGRERGRSEAALADRPEVFAGAALLLALGDADPVPRVALVVAEARSPCRR